jgi:imidazolonepropionase-like amidohydrolase
VRLHVRGRSLPDETPVQYWIVDQKISVEPVAGPDTVFDGGWIIPGLVDAHCHVGIGPPGPVTLDEAIGQAQTERRRCVAVARLRFTDRHP